MSASLCQGNGMVGPFADAILMVVRAGSGMVLCSAGPPVAISIELGFHPLGRVLYHFRKLICMEFGYPKGLMLKGQDGRAVKVQSTKLGSMSRAGSNLPPTSGHLGAGRAPVHAEGTAMLCAAEA